jgi:hypothetical protein
MISRALGAGDADVEEAALLFDLVGVIISASMRPGDRGGALLNSGHEDDRELQALRGVERDQGDRVVLVLVVEASRRR